MQYGRSTNKFIPQIGAFESTQIICGEQSTDVAVLTNHDLLWKEDLLRLHRAGVKMLRFPIRWHVIQAAGPGSFDWTWHDEVLSFIHGLNMEVIADPCHHVSHPLWVENGFLNPHFAEHYLAFVQACAKRYPWIKCWTPLNEPFPTAIMAGHKGDWYPYGNGDHTFVPMVKNMARTICLVSNWLIQNVPGATIVHTDGIELHRTHPADTVEWDLESQSWTAFLNERKFLVLDLILGRVTDTHPMWWYPEQHGFEHKDLSWFKAHASKIHVLGMDYYAHSSEQFWDRDGHYYPSPHPVGLARIARDYVERYPEIDQFMVTETNIRGYVTCRLSWLKYTMREAEKLNRYLHYHGKKLLGFCWFPSVHSHSWDECCAAIGKRDPVGIWYLEDEEGCWERHTSELSFVFTQLARGTITWKDIMAYQLREDLEIQLTGFKRLMPFDWVNPVEHEAEMLAQAQLGSPTLAFLLKKTSLLPVF